MNIVADFYDGKDKKPITEEEINVTAAEEANQQPLGEIPDHEPGSIAPPVNQNLEDEIDEQNADANANYQAPENPLEALSQLDFSGLDKGPDGTEDPEEEEIKGKGGQDPLEKVVDGEGDPETFTAQQVEDLKAQWMEDMKSQAPQTDENIFANEQIKKLNEIVKAGGTIDNKFWEYQNIDFDAADLKNSDVVREVLKAHLTDISGYSDEDAEFLLEDKYPLLGKKLGEEAYEEDKLAHQKEGRKAKIEAAGKIKELKEYQKSLMLPKIDPNQQQAAPQAPQISPEDLAKYTADATAHIDDYDGFDFDLGKDVTLSFTPDEKDMGYIRSVVGDLNKQDTFFSDRYVENGEINYDKFQTEMHILNNLDGILKEAFQQMGAISREKMAKEDGISPQIRKGKPVNTGGEIKSMANQVLANMKY
jgi:hypothetical protein